jgi:hypothetical protein
MQILDTHSNLIYMAESLFVFLQFSYTKLSSVLGAGRILLEGCAGPTSIVDMNHVPTGWAAAAARREWNATE